MTFFYQRKHDYSKNTLDYNYTFNFLPAVNHTKKEIEKLLNVTALIQFGV